MHAPGTITSGGIALDTEQCFLLVYSKPKNNRSPIKSLIGPPQADFLKLSRPVCIGFPPFLENSGEIKKIPPPPNRFRIPQN